MVEESTLATRVRRHRIPLEGGAIHHDDSKLTIVKAAYGVPYTTSGQLLSLNTGGLTNITTRLHLISRHRSKSLESKVDYTHPIVYSEIDSALSYPCERNSVALQNMAGAWSSRKRRDHDYEVIKSKALVIIDKGKVDDGLRGLGG